MTSHTIYRHSFDPLTGCVAADQNAGSMKDTRKPIDLESWKAVKDECKDVLA